MSFRSATGLLLLALLSSLALTACQTTETQRIIDVGPDDTRSTITGTIVDSLTGEPLDSVTVSYRGAGQTLKTNIRGEFVLPDVPPGVYVFDLSKYGYHDRRNVAAVVNPDDRTVEITTTMLSQSLDMQCNDVNADYHSDVNNFLEDDSTGVRLRTLDFVAEDGGVYVQPVVSNNVNAPIFMPENLGAYGHYELSLVRENGDPVSFSYPGAPPQGDGMGDKRVYERGDVRVIVPRESQRLDPTEVQIDESVANGTPIYAKMRYNFSLDQTLRPTPTSTFPAVNLDSLRAPYFDTLRVSDRLIVPDSLIIGVDTTLVRVLGTDTTITRDDQVLYSSDENDTLDVNTALSLLRLRPPEEPLGPVTLPPIDTTRPPLYIVDRFEDRKLDTLIADPARLDGFLEASWTEDSTETRALRTRRRPLWRHEPPTASNPTALDSLLAQVFVPDSVRIDSLLSDSTLLSGLLPPPDTTQNVSSIDTMATDSIAADSTRLDTSHVMPTASDSVDADSMLVDTTGTDITVADSIRTEPATDSTQTPPMAGADSVAVDTVHVDSAAVDTTVSDSTAITAAPPEPRITIDSLRKTVDVDSLRDARRTEILRSALERDTSRTMPLEMIRSAVLVDSLERSIRGDSLRSGLPPTEELVGLAATLDSLSTLPPIPEGDVALSVPQAWTRDSTRVLLLSPMFLRQPMTPLLDTMMVDDVTSLTPQRLLLRPKRLSQVIVQQIILAPISVYRDDYLDTWAEVQRVNLRDPYCDILRIPLETEWRSTTVQ
ncbi:hypothetical protein CRI94_02965 [Longibacter salinarum]|uniref:Carboxypeptidase regulatory-like domain-containing protein n=1 Tax=Longibacter salinarum TaxID=1850348 RepID=A0A2A8D2T0_9BACT|nr:carboxypeptidase regulatory-like domain-containing protein [Longibacter salinarum]PEN15255.1 hypothetical protein CRI94_02965 [Longibacter salinarum]